MNEPSIRTKLTKGKAQPTLGEATEMVWHKARIDMYPISNHQLDELTAGYNSLHLVCFGICVGAALALGIACQQVSHEGSERIYYFAGTLVMSGLAVLFAITGGTNFYRAYRCKRKLYKESIPIERD
jgi:hypothetical protein